VPATRFRDKLEDSMSRRRRADPQSGDQLGGLRRSGYRGRRRL